MSGLPNGGWNQIPGRSAHAWSQILTVGDRLEELLQVEKFPPSAELRRSGSGT